MWINNDQKKDAILAMLSEVHTDRKFRELLFLGKTENREHGG